VWERFGHFDEMTGDVQLNAGLKEVERETQLRLFSAALRFVASREYAPRREPLETLWDGVLRGTGGTLHGCEVRSTRDGIHIFREFRALADLASPAEPGALWDNRWRVQDDVPPGLALRALCEGGWHQIAERQEGAPAFRSARSLPSLWRGNRLHACPAMGVGPPGYLSLTPMRMPGLSMPEFLLSH
jgi:tRNA(Ile)-lysidine synthase